MVEHEKQHVELQPILDDEGISIGRIPEIRPSRTRSSILNNPVFKASLRNMALIITWYALSPCSFILL